MASEAADRGSKPSFSFVKEKLGAAKENFCRRGKRNTIVFLWRGASAFLFSKKKGKAANVP